MNVSFYENVDDMFDDLNASMEAADAAVKDWQTKIKVGDKFIQETDMGFNIYGEILELHKRRHLKHYRLSFAFSEACPLGEMGDVHVSSVTDIINEEAYQDLLLKFGTSK